MTDVEKAMLGFERRWWRYAGNKEAAIMAEFGMSPTRYYQVLNALLDSDEAWVADPLLVGRLRRVRDSRLVVRRSRLSSVRQARIVSHQISHQ